MQGEFMRYFLLCFFILLSFKATANEEKRSYFYSGTLFECMNSESGFIYSYQTDVFEQPVVGFQCSKTKHHLEKGIIYKNKVAGITVTDIKIRYAKDVNGRTKTGKELSFT